jgi:hypothetical protein
MAVCAGELSVIDTKHNERENLSETAPTPSYDQELVACIQESIIY